MQEQPVMGSRQSSQRLHPTPSHQPWMPRLYLPADIQEISTVTPRPSHRVPHKKPPPQPTTAPTPHDGPKNTQHVHPPLFGFSIQPRRAQGSTDARTGPLSREDQSLGLSVSGRLPFATPGWAVWTECGGTRVSMGSGIPRVDEERRVRWGAWEGQ